MQEAKVVVHFVGSINTSKKNTLISEFVLTHAFVGSDETSECDMVDNFYLDNVCTYIQKLAYLERFKDVLLR